ncbi:hypothetical protein TeGR_g6254 [Tetraparma gracilis]|uniref:MYND-type domain-containing protein n=1 Tax=Tetraparma gracilis TaxID=2962635 RepID=A0ABQ6MP07_9STRA|nr:hypothetical protein TeGR_g6254 [Tetraparma gracilis]
MRHPPLTHPLLLATLRHPQAASRSAAAMAYDDRVFNKGMVQLIRSIESGQRPADAILAQDELLTLAMPNRACSVLMALCTRVGDWTGLLRRVLAAGADVNAGVTDPRDTRFNISPLSAAISSGRPDVVEILLRAGADLGVVDANGKTPLRIAVEYAAVDQKQIECIQLLVEAGADANAANDAGQTPLLGAVVGGMTDAATIMLQGGADANQQVVLPRDAGITTLINIAVARGFCEITKALVKAGARLDSINTYGSSPLSTAAADGYVDIVDYLVGAGADVDATDDEGRSALYCAVHGYSLPAVKSLLQGGADPNVVVVAKTSLTPLSMAARIGNLEMCEALLDAGADVDIAGAFSMAVASADVSLVRYFVEVAGANTETGSPFHAAVHPPREEGDDGASMEADYIHTLKYLLGLGVYDVNEPDTEGWSPLHYAMMDDRLVFVALLLEHGADANAGVLAEGVSVTPIMCAKSEGVEKFLRMRLKAGRCGYPLCGGGAEGGKLQSCSRCNRVFYCSKACQRAHWPDHKRVCGASYGLSEDGDIVKLPSSK